MAITIKQLLDFIKENKLNASIELAIKNHADCWVSSDVTCISLKMDMSSGKNILVFSTFENWERTNDN